MSIPRLLLLACLLAPAAAQAQDAIIGMWVGTVKSGEYTFDTQLTFVSPKGGISRYPRIPCGGVLAGDRKGDAYEYTETVTWGGLDGSRMAAVSGPSISPSTANFFDGTPRVAPTKA